MSLNTPPKNPKESSLQQLKEFLTSYPKFIWMIIIFTISPLILTFIVFLFLTAIKPTVIVPQMVGLSVLDASSLAQSKNIKTVLVEQSSEFYPQYFVVAQDIEAGRSVKKDRELILYVSSGGVSHDFPSFIGKNIYLISSSLQQTDPIKQKIFISNINWVESKKPFGEIIDQSPIEASYKNFPIGVTFTVSNGASGKVPLFVGQYATSALYYLAQNNINVVTQEKPTNNPSEDGKVLYQTPAEGTILDKSDSMYVEIGKYTKRKSDTFYFTYTVPSELDNQFIALILSDNKGERTIYQTTVKLGDVIALAPRVFGDFKCTIYKLENGQKVFYKEIDQ